MTLRELYSSLAGRREWLEERGQEESLNDVLDALWLGLSDDDRRILDVLPAREPVKREERELEEARRLLVRPGEAKKECLRQLTVLLDVPGASTGWDRIEEALKRVNVNLLFGLRYRLSRALEISYDEGHLRGLTEREELLGE